MLMKITLIQLFKKKKNKKKQTYIKRVKITTLSSNLRLKYINSCNLIKLGVNIALFFWFLFSNFFLGG